MSRVGVRVQDLFDEKILRQKVEGALLPKNQLLVKIYNRAAIDVSAVVTELLEYADRLQPMVHDTSLLLNNALDAARRCCSRPARRRCSTSTTAPIRSSPRRTRPPAAPAPVRASAPPASTASSPSSRRTRPASAAGPFPDRTQDADGEKLRAIGAEFGVTTGRPRRCGWYDAVIARYAARVNGVTDFVLTKLDMLSEFDRIPVCVAYRLPDGSVIDEMPMTQTDFHHASPSTRSSPAGARIFRRSANSTTCPRTPVRTSRRCRTCQVRRSV